LDLLKRDRRETLKAFRQLSQIIWVTGNAHSLCPGCGSDITKEHYLDLLERGGRQARETLGRVSQDVGISGCASDQGQEIRLHLLLSRRAQAGETASHSSQIVCIAGNRH
jgi:hypothetical protein